ncbi:unnamed protein product [Acanthoscelides obtectus]|uniref:Uncharacterized protein n=1 Tax=Acanthoscelides obtectus TaxID=200917 RepID=A0A9P0P0V6_ACAOB|nr:unnamed protein product [Acanthoscelides obtectus]CAK1622747.1 hypothetical protein AOBTE_LOCUS1653 [Acanthoscelides obtectus]
MAAAVASILKYLENNNQDYPMDQNIEIPHQRAKKRRLDHLTWEEKNTTEEIEEPCGCPDISRQEKSKNGTNGECYPTIVLENESLMAECESLKLDNQRLSQENQELFNRLRAPCVSCSQNRSVACEAPGSTASACPTSSSAQDRLQQRGGATHSAAALTATPTAAPATPTITPRSAHLLRALSRTILLTCLLCRTSSTSWNATRRPGRAATGRPSTGRNSNSSRKAYLGTSPGILRQLHRRLNVMNPKEIDKIVIEKWWGRHQRSWNPVDVKS